MYAYLKIAQRLDDMMQTAGLKVTRTGGLDVAGELRNTAMNTVAAAGAAVSAARGLYSGTKKIGAVGGKAKVYCDECTMLSDYAAMDTARSQAAWFFEDFGDEDEREDEKHESEQETDTAPLITITDESKLPKATRQSRESLLELISSRKRS